MNERYSDGTDRLDTSGPLAPVLMMKPTGFNNLWVEQMARRRRIKILEHNQEVLCRMVEELLEAEPLDADAYHYGRLISEIRGGERVDINPKSGGQTREEKEAGRNRAESGSSGSVPPGDRNSPAMGGVVHLGKKRRSSDEGQGWPGLSSSID